MAESGGTCSNMNRARSTAQEQLSQIPDKDFLDAATKVPIVAKANWQRFLEKEVAVTKGYIEKEKALLEKLEQRFEKAYGLWHKRSGLFKLANLMVTLILVVIQVGQVALFQFSDIPDATKASIASVLSAITGAVLAIQLKLGWGEKAMKSKRCASLFKKFKTNIRYRIEMTNVGAKFDDTHDLWNAALAMENTEIPAYLFAH